ILSVLLLIVYQSQSLGVGLAMAAGIGGTLLLLWLAARAAARLLRRSPRGGLPYTVRQGIANLYRPGNQTVTVVLALGFGAFLIATLILTQANILRPLAVNTETRFNLILLDVQADQVEPVARILARHGVDVLQSVPLVSMRIAAVKGESVRPRDVSLDALGDGREAAQERRGGPRGWAVRREYRSTFRAALTDSERLIAGEWWGAGEADERLDAEGSAPYRVSLEQGIAEELGVGIGDRIDWDIQGVIVPTVVASLRAVDWARLEPNFFAVFEPAALEAAPQMWVLLARGEHAEARALAQRDVVADHSNVSAIDLTLVQAALDEVLGRVSVVIRFLAGFSVATGFIVLLGAVATGRLQRIRESVLLKTLGATRRQIGAILLAEYAALGVLAAIVGAGLSVAAAWALARHLFDVPFAAEPVPLVTLAIGIAVLSALIG